MDQQNIGKLLKEKKSYKRQKRKSGPVQLGIILISLAFTVLLVILFGNAIKGKLYQPVAMGAEEPESKKITDLPESEKITDLNQQDFQEETTVSAEELERQRVQLEKQEVVAAYQNLGLVQVSGFLNVRQEPNTDADIIGKLYGDSACEILEGTEDGWYKVSSGGFEGYISAEFVLSGEEAKEKAIELVELRAVVLTDSLNIRKEASKESDSVGKVMQNERYAVKSQTDGWVEINSGYLSAEFVEVKYALNEARKLDMREMVINLYDNMGISNVTSYLNMRDKPSEDGKIIGKMTSKSAGEILETVDGWYKIKSGPVTGYVKSDYILTGNEAKTAAMQAAELMVIVSTETLNVRTEPTTEASIWTQISNSEKYLVVSQQDGWVEIELDTTTGYVATDYVDVRYALAEAIKFTPLEEKSTSSGSGGSGSGSSSSGSTQTQSKRVQIVNYALQFLGNPYVWGGTSLTNGADCSGFTMSVFAKFGVSLPHHSGSQAGKGRTISAKDMRAGDLIFYSDSSGTINHVALYIGNGQVVHASSAKTGIKISSWNYRNAAKIVNVLGD